MTAVMSIEQTLRDRYAVARKAARGPEMAINVAEDIRARQEQERLDALQRRASVFRLEERRRLREQAKSKSHYAKLRRAEKREEELRLRPRPEFDAIIAALPEQGTMMQLAECVLRFFKGLTIHDIRTEERRVYVAYARHCVAAALWVRKRNLAQVGRFICRDHTSVLHSVRKMGVHVRVRQQGKRE